MEEWTKFIDVIVWPITTIFLAFVFKGEIRKIISRIEKLKYKGIEASFNKELAKVEETTKETNKLVHPSSGRLGDLRDSFSSSLDRILHIAEVSPRASISEAWREVEQSAATLMHAYGHNPRNVQMSKVFRGIVQENNYPRSVYEDYRRLMKLRNSAVHATDFEFDSEEAERYAKTAIDLAVFIEKLAQEAPNKSSKRDAVIGAPS